MADDLRSILIANLPQDIIGVPGTDYIIEYIIEQDIDTINHGIGLEEVRGDLHQKGYTRQQTDAHAGDWYECHCISDNKPDLDDFISQIVKASVSNNPSFGFKGNDTYEQIDPDVNDIVKGGNSNFLWVKFLILCVKNNKNIYEE